MFTYLLHPTVSELRSCVRTLQIRIAEEQKECQKERRTLQIRMQREEGVSKRMANSSD